MADLPVNELNNSPLGRAQVAAWYDVHKSTVPAYMMRRRSTVSEDPGITDWNSIPILTREQVQQMTYRAFLSESVDWAGLLGRGEIQLVSTSGSSESKMRAALDRRAGIPTAYWWHLGLPPPNTIGEVVSPACQGSGCGGLPDPGIAVAPNPFTTDDKEFVRGLELFEQRNPTVILANPTYLQRLIARAQQLGQPFGPKSVLLCSFEYLSHAHRRAFRTFGSVHSVYGATELGGTDVALTCKSGHWHILENAVYVEEHNTNEDGIGELLVSTPLSRTSPLYRYSIGDLAKLSDCDDLNCGLGGRIIEEFHGRKADLLWGRFGAVTTKSFDDALESFEWIEAYQARQRLGKLVFHFVAADKPVSPELLRVTEALHVLGFDALELCKTESLPLETSGKFRLTGAADEHPIAYR